MATRFQSIKQWWQQNLAQHFMWWAGVTAGIIILGGSWWLLRPLYHDLSSNNQAEVLAQKLTTTQERLGVLQARANDWQLKHQNQSLAVILPSLSDQPDLLVQLEAIANHAQLKVQALSLSDQADVVGSTGTKATGVAAVDGLRQIKVNLSLAGGSYARLRDFLQAAQAAWRLLSVDSLNFARDGAYAVTLSSYYYSH